MVGASFANIPTGPHPDKGSSLTNPSQSADGGFSDGSGTSGGGGGGGGGASTDTNPQTDLLTGITNALSNLNPFKDAPALFQAIIVLATKYVFPTFIGVIIAILGMIMIIYGTDGVKQAVGKVTSAAKTAAKVAVIK